MTSPRPSSGHRSRRAMALAAAALVLGSSGALLGAASPAAALGPLPPNAASAATPADERYVPPFEPPVIVEPPTWVAPGAPPEGPSSHPSFDAADVAASPSAASTSAPAGSVSGTVRDSTGRVVGGICVDGSTFDPNAPRNSFSARSGDDGTYRATAVPPDTYRVAFFDCSGRTSYPRQYYAGTDEYPSATPVAVASGQDVGGVDAALRPYGRLTGSVSRAGSTETSGLCVDAHRAADGVFAGSTGTRPDGSFDLHLGVGSYQVRFTECRPPDGSSFAAQWYRASVNRSGATTVAVTDGGTSVLDPAVLSPGGAVTGTVVDADGVGVEGVCVSAYRADELSVVGGQWSSAWTTSGPSGSYSLRGLAAGDHVIGYYDCRPGQGPSSSHYYDQARTALEGTRVGVTPGAPSSGIVLRLPARGTVTGVVRESGGQAVSGICVFAYTNTVRQPNHWHQVGTARSAPDGTYTMPTEVGEVRVTFQDCRSTPEYVPQLYRARQGSDWASGEPVTVVRGATATGVDAHLVRGARVTGTVTDSAGQPVPRGVAVGLVPAGTAGFTGALSAQVGTGGRYTALVPPGPYKLQFFTYGAASHLLPEWHADKRTYEAADVVTAGSESPVVVNAELARAAVVGGQVTSARSGEPVVDACVNVRGARDNTFSAFARSGADGRYAASVPAGRYKLVFFDCSTAPVPRFLGEWWNDKHDFESADELVAVTGEQVTADVALAQHAALTGTVRDAGSTPLSAVCVEAWTLDAARVLAAGVTGRNGEYRAVAPPGDYKLRFRDCSGGDLASRWSGPASSFESATPVRHGTQDTRIDMVLTARATQQPPTTATTQTGGVRTEPSGDVTVTMPAGQRSALALSREVVCPSGDQPSDVELVVGGQAFAMVPAGDGRTWSVTVPPTAVVSGELVVRSTCGSSTEVDTAGRIVLYDPSGIVTNRVTGLRVVGAEVTLHKVAGWRPRTSSAENGEPGTCESHASKPVGVRWSQPAPAGQDEPLAVGSGLFSPDVLVQATNAAGRYGWDVAEGCWYVTVEKDGFVPFTSPVVGVPPEVTDLDLALEPDCSTGPDTDGDGVRDRCDRVIDVANDSFAYPYVRALVDAGITAGCSAAGEPLRYCPDNAVKRGDMAIFLARAKLGRAAADQLPPYTSGFGDVSPSDYYATYVQWLKQGGVTAGCGTGYCPQDSVRRSDMSIFLSRTKLGTAAAGVLPAYESGFSDVAPGDYYSRWVRWAKDAGVTAGCGGDRFCPTASVDRRQMAVFLVRTFGLQLPSGE